MTSSIHVGMFRGLGGPFTEPEHARRFAIAMENLGYESLWGGEHIVLSTAAGSRIPATTPIPDLIVVFSHLAAVTTRLRFGTAVVNVPQHDPILLAKQIATLDLVSGGRISFGVGLGGSELEYRALGIAFERRGARADEYLDAIEALWTMDAPAYAGEFVSFSEIDAHPRPIQRGGIPLIVGGKSNGAYRRAIRRANGWFGFGLDLSETAECLAEIAEVASQTERPAHLGELEISVAVRGELDSSIAASFAELGVHRIVSIAPTGLSDAEFTEFLEARSPRALRSS